MTVNPRRELRHRLTAIAGAQSGYFSAAQARAAGYSYQAQKQNADRGNWVKVGRGLFRLPGWPTGRDPDTLRFSLMTTCVVGRDRAELRERLGRLLDRTGRGGTAEALIESAPEHWLLGTVDQVAERLRGYEAAGVQRVMLQHLVHDDLDM